MTPQQRRSRIAKKATKTRAHNKYWQERWEKVDKPSYQRLILLANELLKCGGHFDVRWNPLSETSLTLMKGATKGRVVKFVDERTVRVKPHGYKTARDYPWSFWEPIL